MESVWYAILWLDCRTGRKFSKNFQLRFAASPNCDLYSQYWYIRCNRWDLFLGKVKSSKVPVICGSKNLRYVLTRNEGWEQNLVGMRVGGQHQLIIPPELGFGETQTQDIPPNSILVIGDSDLPY